VEVRNNTRETGFCASRFLGGGHALGLSIDQHEHHFGSAVPKAGFIELQDSGVPTLTLGVPLGHIFKKFGHNIFVVEFLDGLTTGMQSASLCQRDHLFSQRSSLFGAGFRRGDGFMDEQATDQVLQHGRPVAVGTTEGSSLDAVLHD
jgi:hypothetical protein